MAKFTNWKWVPEGASFSVLWHLWTLLTCTQSWFENNVLGGRCERSSGVAEDSKVGPKQGPALTTELMANSQAVHRSQDLARGALKLLLFAQAQRSRIAADELLPSLGSRALLERLADASSSSTALSPYQARTHQSLTICWRLVSF